MAGLTEAVGHFIAGLGPDRVRSAAMETARLGFIDCIGTMVAGRGEAAVLAPAILAEAVARANSKFADCLEVGERAISPTGWFGRLKTLEGIAARATAFGG